MEALTIPNDWKDTLLSAEKKWGEYFQSEMVIEECAELIACIQHERRGRLRETVTVDEAADVFIVAYQAGLIRNEKLFHERVQYKIDRLKERVQKGNRNLKANDQQSGGVYEPVDEHGSPLDVEKF